jgi:hypothetical protein
VRKKTKGWPPAILFCVDTRVRGGLGMTGCCKNLDLFCPFNDIISRKTRSCRISAISEELCHASNIMNDAWHMGHDDPMDTGIIAEKTQIHDVRGILCRKILNIDPERKLVIW